jgi:hypothetical protein
MTLIFLHGPRALGPNGCRAAIVERGELALLPQRVAPQYSTITYRAQQEAPAEQACDDPAIRQPGEASHQAREARARLALSDGSPARLGPKKMMLFAHLLASESLT